MKSLKIGDRNPNFDYRIFALSNLTQINSQKAITIIKHKMAVQKSLGIIEARMQDPPTLGELASFLGMSRTYFSYVFKEVTGMRLQDYLIQARFNKAKELLGNIDFKIKQIAYEAGFSDPNYFCRTFKKKTGSNPTDWRLAKFLKHKNRNEVQKTI